MPKETIIKLGEENEARVKALIAERKKAVVDFNAGLQKLSQLESGFRDIYSGQQIVNHTDLVLLRNKYTGFINECTKHLAKMSADERESSALILQQFKEKAAVLEKFWYTDCGPISQPFNRLLSHLLEISTPLEPYIKRQLDKCREQIQEIINNSRGVIDAEHVDKLKTDIAERYNHYREKIIEKVPGMVSNLPELTTDFFKSRDYSNVLNLLGHRNTTVHEITPPAYKPAPPPGPSPRELEQARLREQLERQIKPPAYKPPPPPGPSPREREQARFKEQLEQGRQENDSPSSVRDLSPKGGS